MHALSAPAAPRRLAGGLLLPRLLLHALPHRGWDRRAARQVGRRQRDTIRGSTAHAELSASEHRLL
eukprot:4790412-Alexandrium_andersonii.AAC.1